MKVNADREGLSGDRLACRSTLPGPMGKTPFGPGLWLRVGLAALCLFSACALPENPRDDGEKTPAQLMQEGRSHFAEGRYKDAARTFEKVRNLYPYSDFTAEAQRKTADAFFNIERYAEAQIIYQEYERDHPQDPDLAYVIYRQGMSLFRRIHTVDRDRPLIVEAQNTFERLARKFPRSEFAAKAQDRIRDCRTYLAEYELHVGHFYFSRKKYPAAMGRYSRVIEQYPGTPPAEEAREYLGKCLENHAEGSAPPAGPLLDQDLALPAVQPAEPAGPGAVVQKRPANPTAEETAQEAADPAVPEMRPPLPDGGNPWETPSAGPTSSFQSGSELEPPEGPWQAETGKGPTPSPAGSVDSATGPLHPAKREPAGTPSSVSGPGEGTAVHRQPPPQGPETASPQPAPGPERAEKARYSIQVGAFLVKSNAERFVAELVREGYKPYILHTTGYRKRHWYAVRIKDYSDLAAAQQDATDYQRRKGRPAIVTRIDSIQPVAGPGRAVD